MTRRDQAQREADNQRAAVDQAREKQAAEEEVRSGKCSAQHAAELQQILQGAKQMFDGAASGSEWYSLVRSDILVAAPQGTAVPQESYLGGEFHVIAISRLPVKLEASDDHGNASALRSQVAGFLLGRLAQGGSMDTRILQVNHLTDAKIRVTGGGCALVAVFQHH